MKTQVQERVGGLSELKAPERPSIWAETVSQLDRTFQDGKQAGIRAFEEVAAPYLEREYVTNSRTSIEQKFVIKYLKEVALRLKEERHV